jgi:AAA family ATP:ADP antiporter
VIRYLEKALNLKREELAPAILLFLYLFLAIGCYTMGQSVGKALFLGAFPAYLPHVTIATAVVVGIFASVYIRLSHRLRLEWLVIGSLLFLALGFAGFWWLTRFGESWVYPLIYTWVYVVGAMVPTMGWTLANHSLTTREARRVFGFIGAGAILASSCAGFLTTALTARAHLHPETLLLIIGLGLGFCAVTVKLLFRQRRERLAQMDWGAAAAAGTPKNLGQVWSYICGSRYLVLITALVMIGCCVTTVVDYQFNLITAERFHGDKVAMTAFFGTFNGYIGFSAFLLQMLLTGRLLRSFGIRATLFVMPAVFLGGSLGVLLAPVLLSAAILKGSQNLLRYSVDKSSAELLYLPVSPPEVISQIKSFIDGFVRRMADGLGSIALLVFTALKFSPARMSWLNFGFLIGWIGIAYRVRQEYLTVLRSAIEHRTLDPEKTAANVLDATTAEVLAHSFEHGGEQQALYGLSLFELGREPVWHPVLRKLLDHPSAAVRQRALHLLSETKHHGVEPQVEKMLGDESLEVRAEALQYLVTHEHKDPLLLLQTASDVPEYCLQSVAIIHLTRIGDEDCLAAARHILQEMLNATGPDALASRREAARALGRISGPRAFHMELSKLLDDASPEVTERALLSAGRVQINELLPKVMEKLGQPRLLGAARAALVQYGDAAVPALQERLKDTAVPGRVRRQIPRVLARIGTANSAAALSGNLIQSDPEVRYEVIKALNQLRVRQPDLVKATDIPHMLDYELLAYYRSFQILAALEMPNGNASSQASKNNRLVIQAVRERMEQEFERVFRLLGLVYPPGDMYNAYLSLISHRPQSQANALEMLEQLLAPDLYRRLIVVADPESTSERRLAQARRLCQTSVESGAEALRILLHSGDGWLCACALHAIGQAQMVELVSEVRALNHDESLLEGTWRWTSARLALREMERGDGMLTVLEKVELLRNAPLFQSLPTQSLVRVAAIANELSWAPQQVVYQENSPAESIIFLVEGELELIRGGKVVARRGRHQVLGSMAALASGSHSESAVVSQPTRALRMDREEFFDAMADDFRVARGIVKALAGMADGAA